MLYRYKHTPVGRLSHAVLLERLLPRPGGPEDRADDVVGGSEPKHERPGAGGVQDEPVDRHRQQPRQRRQGVACPKDKPRVAGRNVQVRHADPAQGQGAEAQPDGDDQGARLRVGASQGGGGGHQARGGPQHAQHLQRDAHCADTGTPCDQSVRCDPAHRAHAALHHVREHGQAAQLTDLHVVVLTEEGRQPVDEAVQAP
mmetsp:Transcript_25907/g.66671  ORF Transcript_25907/g.66671 Transcript_25907/m.66671 type:complete len:200 (-) Transcript_25907:1355-1954(-)